MQIKDLQSGQGKVDIVAKVVDKADVREFQKFGSGGKVCNAKIQDESGSMSLTLWNDDVTKVNIGDTVKITNGYVREWQGELQLSTGKFGKMEVVPGNGEVPKKITPTKTTPEKSKQLKTEDEALDELDSDKGDFEEADEEYIDDEISDEKF